MASWDSSSGPKPRLPMGIDIGSSQINGVELEDTLDGVAVTAVGSVATPAGAIKKGQIADRKAIARAMRELVRRGGFSGRTAAMALGGDTVILRWTQLPNLKGEDLVMAARFEARKFLRQDADSYLVEATRLESGPTDADHIRVLIAAAPKSTLEAHAEVADRAGIAVVAIEIEPMAVLRALMRSTGPRGIFWRDQSAAFVVLGRSNIGMYVGQRGELRFARTVPCPENLGDDLSPDRVTREISRVLSYYRSLFPERSYEGILDRVTISGGGACTPGLDHELSERLGIRIEVGNPFGKTITKIAGATFAAIDGRQPHYVVAMGLALGGVKETQWRARAESLLGAAPDADAAVSEEVA